MTLIQEVEYMYSVIKSEYSTEPAELQERIIWLTRAMARSGEIEALLKYELDKKIGEEAESLQEKYPNINPTKFKEILKHRVAKEERDYIMAERLNASITHQLDALRSLLSYQKKLYENQ